MSDPVRPSIRETRREQVFPRLDDRLLTALLPYGERRRYPAGAMPFREGERHVGMFVVLSGKVDIVRRVGDGEEPFVTYLPGMFSGEIGLLGGRAAVASGRAREDSEVLVVDEAALHRVIVTQAELSEL